MTQSSTLPDGATNRQTNGTWRHTGQLIIEVVADNGQKLRLVLPDDLMRLLTLDSLEDLRYGG